MTVLRKETEMFPLVESWQQSGMTQKVRSQQQQIPEHVFTYWVSKYCKKHQQQRQRNLSLASTPVGILLSGKETSAF